LSVAAVGGIGASAFLLSLARRGESMHLRRLAEAVGPHRVTRARITGGFSHAACAIRGPNDSLIAGLTCDDASPLAWSERERLVRLAPEMRSAGAAGPTDARHRHATGVWHMIWGDPDAAIDELRAAALLDPANASLQSDLAAALLQRAEQTQDPLSILDAYTASDSAVALDPRLPEAQFNRALSLESLSLRTDAIVAWTAYLALEDRSAWAREAKGRLGVLRAPVADWPTAQRTLRAAVATGDDRAMRGISQQFPERVRDEVRGSALDWARRHQGAGSRPDPLLPKQLGLARALGDVTGDSLWFDAVRSLVESTETGDPARLDLTARGVAAYAIGDVYLGRLMLDSADVWFRRSERLLSAARSPVRYWAAYGIAAAAYSRQSPAGYRDALVVLRAIRAAAPNAYRVVRGLAARTEGVIEGIRADFGAAIDAYLAATREGRGTGEPGLELRPHANLAGNYANLGDERAAWAHLYDAMRSLPRYAEASKDAQRVFTRAAELSAARSLRVAAVFQREAIRLARLTSSTAADSMVMIVALRREAELLSRQGLTDRALESVRQAREYLARIASDSIRAVLSADVDLVEGQGWLSARPDTAARILQRVVDRYRDTRYFRQVGRAQLLLANAYTATGAMDRAQRAFEAALSETERRRSAITGAEERARFLDNARPVIDTLVKFLADRADTLGAIEFLESMRGRVLLERAGTDSTAVHPARRTVDAVRRRLPVGTSVVSYAVLGDEVLAWLLRRDGISMYRTPSDGKLGSLSQRFSTLVASRSSGDEVRAVAAELHELLIAPFANELEADGRLVVVPDKWLHFVPFAALLDPATGRFLVERFEISIAPSVQLYAQSAARYEELRILEARAVLAVGNPSFDARVYSLPRLPGAEREARRVAASYGQAQLLVDSQATKSAFLRSAAIASVIHFAGHGVVRSDAPLLSYLVFAPDEGGQTSGALTAQELSTHRLPRTRLAVLSGCQTATGRLSDTEGASSLARALFAAGVPAVVASLWAVDDDNTADFFDSYHRALRRGDDPTAALRRTQREWLARDKGGTASMSTWAAFTLFGATTAANTFAGEVEITRVSRSSLP
jgi:CHAT domain-containing protein/tetratricopeptide (TPR) repeat protein